MRCCTYCALHLAAENQFQQKHQSSCCLKCKQTVQSEIIFRLQQKVGARCCMKLLLLYFKTPAAAAAAAAVV